MGYGSPEIIGSISSCIAVAPRMKSSRTPSARALPVGPRGRADSVSAPGSAEQPPELPVTVYGGYG